MSQANQYRFEPLGRRHDRAAFSCGVPALDGYLQRQACQNHERGVAHCHVLIEGEGRIVGAYTLSATALVTQNLPDDLARRLPRYPTLPAILLGRLAVDTWFQGRGFGRRLLVHALFQVREVRQRIGTVAVVVDAKDGAATAFPAALLDDL